jgi:hypothetical protein
VRRPPIRRLAFRATLLPTQARAQVDAGWFEFRHPPDLNVADDRLPPLGEARRAGLAFLELTQRSNGQWYGFVLPPGASNLWMTAHVALILENMPEASGLVSSAAQALRVSARSRGWGWNRRIAADSDTTSQAILVLRRHGETIEPGWVATLMATRHEDGGFGTYASTRPDGLPRTWWDMPHPDVTLFVVEALVRTGQHPRAVRDAAAWLDLQAVDDVVTPYWWTSQAYALWAQSATGFRTKATAAAAARRLADETRPVYLAMLINAAVAGGRRGEEVAAAVRRLERAQLADGSWPCDPCLRNTDSNHPGGEDAPGRVYADPYRVISTAHAVAALWRAQMVSATEMEAASGGHGAFASDTPTSRP